MEWRSRHREHTPLNADEEAESSDDHSAEVIMNTLTLTEAPRHTRFAPRRAKRMKIIDLEAMARSEFADASSSGSHGLFAEPVFAPDEPDTRDVHQFDGSALLCFVTAESFVGIVELEGTQAVPLLLKLHGSETLRECNREFCGASECCGEQAFLLTVQGTQSRKKRSFIARNTGVGDYISLQGRGFRFETHLVPGEPQREQARAATRLFPACLPRWLRLTLGLYGAS